MEWKTAISDPGDPNPRVRGYALSEMIGKLNFSEFLGLLLKGSLPSPEEHIVLDALLVSTCDLRLSNAANLVTRTAASGGAPLEAALGAGLLAMSSESEQVSSCMQLLFQTMDLVSEGKLSLEEAALATVEKNLDAEGGLPGFCREGEVADPAALNLMHLVEGLELPLAGPVQVLQALEVALTAQTEKDLPPNIFGVVAACLCELDLPPELGNAFLILGRLSALTAHWMEQKTRQEQGHLVNPEKAVYDGPGPRELA